MTQAMTQKKIKVLFVCMGNICRSPTAQGVFEDFVKKAGLSEQIVIDSAGTHAYHVGQPPDQRSQAAALERGIDLSQQRARQVSLQDFSNFDYVLAMDQANEQSLLAECSAGQRGRVKRFMSFAPETGVVEVPDPYYGGEQGFERVLDLVEAAAKGLLQHIRKQHQL